MAASGSGSPIHVLAAGSCTVALMQLCVPTQAQAQGASTALAPGARHGNLEIALGDWLWGVVIECGPGIFAAPYVAALLTLWDSRWPR